VQASNSHLQISNFRMSFDLVQAMVARPWFYPEFFMNRGWTLEKGHGWTFEEMPSNGEPLPQGIFIGYPTQAIFVRNLVIESEEFSNAFSSYASQFSAGGSVGLGAVLDQRQLLLCGRQPGLHDGPRRLQDASGVVFFRRIRASVKGEAEAVNQTLGGMGDQLDMGILSFRRQRLQVTPAVAAVRADTPVAAMQLARPGALGTHQTAALAGALRQPLGGAVQAERFQTDAPAVLADPKRRFAMDAIINKRLVIRRPDLLPQPAPPPAPPPQPGNSVLETAPRISSSLRSSVRWCRRARIRTRR